MRTAQTQEPTTQTPALNTELLDQYRSRKSNLLERLISAFLQEAPDFYQNIRKASETGDLNEIRLAAHSLKSCSHNLGAIRLSRVCQDLESAAISNDLVKISSSMQQIGSEWFEAEQALRGELYKSKQTKIAQQPAAQIEPPAEDDWN